MEYKNSSLPGSAGFIIVKNASKAKWPLYFDQDPHITGLPESFSYGLTEEGRSEDIAEIYWNYQDAMEDTIRLNGGNPFGDFDVCCAKQHTPVSQVYQRHYLTQATPNRTPRHV